MWGRFSCDTSLCINFSLIRSAGVVQSVGTVIQISVALTYTLVQRPTHTAVLKPFPLTHASLA